jgi:hypothetical protein
MRDEGEEFGLFDFLCSAYVFMDLSIYRRG